MKCPNCGQEMIDIKDYCVKCGKRLKKEQQGISLGKLLIIFLVFIVIGIGVCYYIANYGINEEIKPYLNKNN